MSKPGLSTYQHKSTKSTKSYVAKLLKELLKCSDENKMQALKTELLKKINDPGMIEGFQQFSDQSIYRQEARIIMDSFEAATNGMENPHAFERLDQIQDSSILAPWKQLTLAIYNLYKGDWEKTESHLNKIHTKSPPVLVKKLLHSLMAQQPSSTLNSIETALYKRIIEDDGYISSLITQLEDYLSENMLDLMVETTLLAIKDFADEHADVAKQLSLWCFNTLQEYDISPTDFLKNLKPIFGEAETLRIFSLSMVSDSPDISLLFWIKSFICLLFEGNLDQLVIEEYIRIASELAFDVKCFLEEYPDLYDDSFNQGLESLMPRLKELLEPHFPEKLGPDDQPLTDLNSIAKLAGLLLRAGSTEQESCKPEKTKEFSGRPKKRVKRSAPKQLELFH